jgi:regulator of protease activity HflC (stomatin/prohibitin superfamily)
MKTKKEQFNGLSSEMPDASTKNAWLGAGIMALAAILLWPTGLKDLSVTLFSALLVLTGSSLKAIKDPEIGFLWQMGKFKGRLNAGWHLGLPFIWEIEVRTLATQEILFREEMYTQAKKEIILRGAIYYRLADPKRAINLPAKTVESRIKNVTLSKIKGKIGEMSFKKLLEERGTVENKIIAEANNEKELGADGYEVTGIEIADLKEQIESKAAKIKEIGSAEAEVDKKKAKALAEPLKGNYPAAIAMAIETIGDKIAGKILEVTKTEPKGGEIQ